MFDFFCCIIAIILTGILSYAACYHATMWVKLNPEKLNLVASRTRSTSTKLKADAQSFVVRHGATPWTRFKTEFLDFLRRYGLKRAAKRRDDNHYEPISQGPFVLGIPEVVYIFVLSLVVCIVVLNVAQLFLDPQSPLGNLTSAYILAMLAVSGLSGYHGWSRALLKINVD